MKSQSLYQLLGKKDDNVPGEQEEEEEEQEPAVVGSDGEEDDRAVVGSDAEPDSDSDTASDTASNDSEPDMKAELVKNFLRFASAPAAAIEKPAMGGHHTRSGLAPLWFDDYFWVADTNKEFLVVTVRDRHKFKETNAAAVWGKAPMTKQVHPRDVGESRSNPVRTLLLLRGWALWRARHNGWADAVICRARHFREQESLLEEDVRALGAPCRLLGNSDANSVFRRLLPDLTARLQKGRASSASSSSVR